MDKPLTVKYPRNSSRKNGHPLNATRYGKLCAETLPKVIESDKEFDRMVEHLERLTFKQDATPEEKALSDLLTKLIQDYDDANFPLPDVAPHKMIQFLMEQRGLGQSDLAPVLGSRAQVSAAVNGTRSVSKAHAKKLAEFFHMSADLFI